MIVQTLFQRSCVTNNFQTTNAHIKSTQYQKEHSRNTDTDTDSFPQSPVPTSKFQGWLQYLGLLVGPNRCCFTNISFVLTYQTEGHLV